jgi:molecular chaperone IbpA
VHTVDPLAYPGRASVLSLPKEDIPMRAFDFAPLYRTTVGFDRLAGLLDQVSGLDTEGSTFPPYNIERLGETEYRISMAVAGFSQGDIKIELKEQVLTVTGEKAADDQARQYLHRGIAGRTFARRFQLADHVEVKAADLKDGLLHIDLSRNVPERLKPRSIAIGQGKVGTTQVQIEAAA